MSGFSDFVSKESERIAARDKDERTLTKTVTPKQLLGFQQEEGQRWDLTALIKKGFPIGQAEFMAQHLGMDVKDFLIDCVGMSESTVRRRFKERQVLSAEESDRVVRYAHLMSLATALMNGSETDACTWLRSPAFALGGATPLEVASTETGARRIEDLIVSLEYGMFS